MESYRLAEFRFGLLMGVYTNLFSHFTQGMGVLTAQPRFSGGAYQNTVSSPGSWVVAVGGNTPAVVEHCDRESGNSLDLELEAH